MTTTMLLVPFVSQGRRVALS